MKKCPFCENLVKQFKTESHIIPKWMHRLSFGKQSKTYNVDLEEKRMTIAQDGQKGVLFVRIVRNFLQKMIIMPVLFLNKTKSVHPWLI
jgi:hypothetical protein